MREAVEELNQELEQEQGIELQLRTGVNTGEVVAGDPADGQTLVTGDAVNVAARLEQAAGPGEILIGEATHRLVRDAVRLEPTGPLTLKGKDEARPLLAGARDRRWASRARRAVRTRRSSGAERELARLRDAFEGVVHDSNVSLFTVLGGAGIGKSRLARELETAVSDAARVLTGRCLPYGDGITYWPLFEIVRDLVSGDEEPSPAIARSSAGREGADAIAERIAGALGPRPRRRRRRRLPGPSGSSSRPSPTSVRSSSCSRICTGPSRRCST